jgi:hypothetical protein
MKDSDQERERKRGQFSAQEMQKAFVDWVRKLRFAKRGVPKDPGRADLQETSAEQTSAPDPPDGRPSSDA